jgi:hypothetical protein
VSCAPSGDEGHTSHIEIEKTRNKLSETKGNNKKTNEQTNKIKKNIKKKKKKKKKTYNNPRAYLFIYEEYYTYRFYSLSHPDCLPICILLIFTAQRLALCNPSVM